MPQRLAAALIAASVIIAAAIVTAAVLPRYLDQRARDNRPTCIGQVSAAKAAELGCKR